MDRRPAHDHRFDPPAECPPDRCRESGRAGDLHRPVRRFVLQQPSADGSSVGVIRGVQAIGGVIGGVVIGVVGSRIGVRPMIGWGFIAFGLISLVTWNLPAVTTVVPVYALLFVLVGIPGVADLDRPADAGPDADAPVTPGARVRDLRGGRERAVLAVGVLIAGALADRTGVLPILDVQALIYVGCGCAALVALREGKRRPTAYAAAPIGRA